MQRLAVVRVSLHAKCRGRDTERRTPRASDRSADPYIDYSPRPAHLGSKSSRVGLWNLFASTATNQSRPAITRSDVSPATSSGHNLWPVSVKTDSESRTASEAQTMVGSCEAGARPGLVCGLRAESSHQHIKWSNLPVSMASERADRVKESMIWPVRISSRRSSKVSQRTA
jgi:hypothetical protein